MEPRYITRLCLVVILAACCVCRATAQPTGPDVIIADLFSPISFGSSGGISAFSVGTDACNIGDHVLWWFGSNNVHPVIAQAVYRMHDGRFEQIGMSWLKHGFAAANGSTCGTCTPAAPTALGVFCSDAYGASTNAVHGTLGPRSDVNAATGWFPHPHTMSPPSTAIGGRLQVHDSDLDPAAYPGARYFIEAQYVHPEDALWGNDDNNASWRELDFSGSSPTPLAPTVSGQAAIHAWPTLDPLAQVVEVDVPQDGRFSVAMRPQPLGGGVTRYVYVVHNLNSDRAAAGFSVSLPAGASASNLTFHDPDYHSGELQNGVDWLWTVAANGLAWVCTETYATNPHANALRFATSYTFSFESDATPGDASIELFKPGGPVVVTVPAFNIPIPEWQENQPESHLDINGLGNNSYTGPIVAQLLAGSAGVVNVSSTAAGSPYYVAVAAGPAIADPVGTPGGQRINVALSAPTTVLIGTANPMTVTLGGQTIPFLTPATAGVLTLQMGVVHPGAADGYSASAANELHSMICASPFPVPTPGPTGDDDALAFTLGPGGLCSTPFVFYGSAYTTLWVGTNGRVLFGSNTGASDFSPSIAEALTGAPFIGFWTDLDPSSAGSITIDVPSSDTIVASYQGLPYFGEPTSSVSFDIVLDAASGGLSLENLSGIGPAAVAATLFEGDPQWLGISSGGGGATNGGPTLFQSGMSGSPLIDTDMIYDWWGATVGTGALVPSLQGNPPTRIDFSPQGNSYSWTAQ